MLNLKKQEGFTLVELMVVVAIIGILSSVAIPQFQIYQAKSRTSEAKLALAAIYSAEIAFQGETDVFAQCLPIMGYRQTGAAAQRYYNVGFNAGAANSSVQAAVDAVVTGCTVGIDSNNNGHYQGSKGQNTASAPTNGTYQVTVAGDGFLAGATGRVQTSSAANSDRWQINQDKALLHSNTGY